MPSPDQPPTPRGRAGPHSQHLKRPCSSDGQPAPDPSPAPPPARRRHLARGKARRVTVEGEITWLDGEAAERLRTAQAHALRKLLTEVATRRTRTDHTDNDDKDAR